MPLNLITNGGSVGTSIQAGYTTKSVINITDRIIVLGHTPLLNGLIVNINGLLQDVAEYTIIGSTITLGNNIELNLNDLITVNYFY